MNIRVNIEGNFCTYTDETPIENIRGLNKYFLEEVICVDDVDTFGLSKALLLHKDAVRDDLIDVLKSWYPREENPHYISGIKELLDIAEVLYFRLKDSFIEKDFFFFLRKCDFVPNIQKDAIQTLVNRGIDNLDIETLIHLYPNIPAEAVIEKFNSKKLDEYYFSIETMKYLYILCIQYAYKGSWDVAQQFFTIFSKTSGFKKITKGHGIFSLTTKLKYNSFSPPDHIPAIMSDGSEGAVVEFVSCY